MHTYVHADKQYSNIMRPPISHLEMSQVDMLLPGFTHKLGREKEKRAGACRLHTDGAGGRGFACDIDRTPSWILILIPITTSTHQLGMLSSLTGPWPTRSDEADAGFPACAKAGFVVCA